MWAEDEKICHLFMAAGASSCKCKRFIRSVNLVQDVTQEDPAGEIRARHTVTGITKGKQVMRIIAMRSDVWQPLRRQ